MKKSIPVTLLTFASLALGAALILSEQDASDPVADHQLTGTDHLAGTLRRTPDLDSWIPISDGATSATALKVVANSSDRLTVSYDLPGFSLAEVDVGGRKCTRINLPDHIKIQEKGLPELPIVAASLIIPATGDSELRIVEHVIRELKMDPVEPSLGHLTRDIDPATVKPTFASLYSVGGTWPAEPAVLSEPFVTRDRRGVNLRLQPLRYDAGSGTLLITEKLVVEIVTRGNAGINVVDPALSPAVSADFDRVHDKLFANYTAPIASDKYTQLETRGRMLIIAHDEFLDEMAPFVQWKQQLGIGVEMVSVSDAGNNALEIGNTIAQVYAEPDGLVWVILVGDREQVPTNSGLFDGSDSDSRYAMLAGADVYPDVFISRISAATEAQVETQVARFIAYEKQPSIGEAAGWYSRALGVASDQGTPPDYKLVELLHDQLLGYDFKTITGVFEGQGGETSDIAAALKDGCSFVNYLGHGSGTSWASVHYGIYDVKNTANAGNLPWIVDVSCYNGRFSLQECFAEAWMRAGTPTEPRGAVGVLAATSLAPWTPPTVMQAEIVKLLTTDKANTLGSLCYSGLMKVLDEYAGLSVAEQVLEQNVLFGDCSLMVRTTEPAKFLVQSAALNAPAANALTVSVNGPAGSIVAVTRDGVLYGSGVVDALGVAQVELVLSIVDVADAQLTVSGFNMVPNISSWTFGDNGIGESSDDGTEEVEPEDEFPVEPAPDTEPNLDPAAPTKVELRGNYPNPFNPETRIAFDLPRDMQVRLAVYDIKGRLIQTLADGQLGAGRQEVIWNGCDSAGRNAASGVYLYHLVTAEGVQTGRMVLSK